VRYVEQDFKVHEEVRCGCPPEDPNLLIPDDARLDCSCDNPGAGFMQVEGNATVMVEPKDYLGYGYVIDGSILDPTFHICYEVRINACMQPTASSSVANDSGVCRILGRMVNSVLRDLATCVCRPPYLWLSSSAAQLQGSRCFSWAGCVWDHSYLLCRFPSSAPSWPHVDLRYSVSSCHVGAC
jgi:hypothetical protein